jgi:calcineurin-like phosphoesterase family protein
LTDWFTSDPHFSHKAIQRFCHGTRCGGSLEEHDQRLIDNWKAQVKGDDRVFLLGDVSFATVQGTEEILQHLTGEIHLIYGNHDTQLRRAKFDRYFVSRQDYKEISIEGQKVVMCHFPIWEWNGMQHGAYNLFGHVHQGYTTTRGRSMNVGIDARPNGDMCLFSWDEVRAFMADKEVVTH